MTTGYSVQMCRKSGALLLVAGHHEIDGYVMVRWTAGRKADGEQILRARAVMTRPTGPYNAPWPPEQAQAA
jgi:hypothetical protein